MVETNTDDLPFLVDSVRGELEARGLQVVRLRHPIMATERVGRRAHPRGARRPRGAAPRVGHALRPRPPARRRGAGRARAGGARRARRRSASCVRDFPAMVERAHGDGPARPRRRLALPGRRGRGGRRLPRLAAARRVRLPRRARVRLHRGRPAARAGLRAGDPRRRGQVARSAASGVPFEELPEYVRRSALEGDLLLVDKSNAPAPVHRRERMDYIGVRRIGRGRRDRRHVAGDRALHDQGLRRAGLRDPAAAPQAAPVPGRPRADRGLARLQGRRRAVRHVPQGRAVRRPGRGPARGAELAAGARGHRRRCACSAAATPTGATPR